MQNIRVPRRLAGVLAGLALFLVACHAPVSVTTPQGKAAYTADQVVQRLGEFQNAAIQANRTGGLDEQTTRQIVTYVVATTKTLKETPAGYVASVQAGWRAFRPTLPSTVLTDPSLGIIIGALDTLIAGLQ